MEWRLATSFPRPTCYRDEDEGLSPADDNDDQKGEDEEDIGGLPEADLFPQFIDISMTIKWLSVISFPGSF